MLYWCSFDKARSSVRSDGFAEIQCVEKMPWMFAKATQRARISAESLSQVNKVAMLQLFVRNIGRIYSKLHEAKVLIQ